MASTVVISFFPRPQSLFLVFPHVGWTYGELGAEMKRMGWESYPGPPHEHFLFSTCKIRNGTGMKERGSIPPYLTPPGLVSIRKLGTILHFFSSSEINHKAITWWMQTATTNNTLFLQRVMYFSHFHLIF